MPFRGAQKSRLGGRQEIEMEWEVEREDGTLLLFDDAKHPPDAFDRHPGCTLIFHLHHPDPKDDPLNPMVIEAFKEYIRRVELGELGNGKCESFELPSGMRMDSVAFGPADLL